MSTNARFKQSYSDRIRKAEEKALLFTRRLILRIFVSLVNMSPVDTGRFRSNWQVGYGSMNMDTNTPIGVGAAVTRAATALSFIRGAEGERVWLTNSLPYAYRLEHGWSQQAPGGMVAITLTNFASMIRETAVEVRA